MVSPARARLSMGTRRAGPQSRPARTRLSLGLLLKGSLVSRTALTLLRLSDGRLSHTALKLGPSLNL